MRLEQEKQAKEEQELETQIQFAAQKQMEQMQMLKLSGTPQQQRWGRRGRANSGATEVPELLVSPLSGGGVGGGDYTPIESFGKELEVNGVRFSTVKLFHARPGAFILPFYAISPSLNLSSEGLGTTYLADPICDDINTSLPLELYTVTFDSPYYTTTQGRKKLNGLQEEIQRLTTIRHPNLVSVFAVKVVHGGGGNAPQLMILMERMPGLMLQDVLEDCAALREERASGYLSQILGALNAVHLRDIVHCGEFLLYLVFAYYLLTDGV